MKRARLLWAMGSAMVILASPALGQRLRGGVQGGVTSSSWGNAPNSINSRWGGTAGVFSILRASRHSGASLEVNWVQKGSSEARLDYIEIPLLLGGFYPTQKGFARLYGGIDFAFKVGCNSESTVYSCDRARSTEWSIPIGLTLGFGSNRTFGVDVRYSLALSDAFENSNVWNRSWQFRGLIGLGGRSGPRRR